jgi:Spy/CpxP family protein refolding chaperone
MKSWKALIAVLGIFVLGTIFGLVISFWIAPSVGAQASPAQEIVTRRFNQRLSRSLSLSPQQEQAIAGIIENTRTQLVEIREETRPHVRQVILNARGRIRAQLNSEQQLQFDRMVGRNRLRLNRLLSR